MKYCEFCGNPIEGKGPCSCPEAQEHAKSNSKKASKRLLFIGLGAVAILTAVIIAVFALSSDSEDGPSPFKKSSKMDPFDYLEITFEGYDGIGTAYIEFDDYAIDEEIFGEEPEDMKEYFEWEARYEDFEGSIEYKCSKEEGLSNGDKITITFTVTDDYRKHVQEKSKEITVKGLTETTKFDFFSNVELIFDGVDGEADVEVKRLLESDIMDTCRFYCSPSYDLKAGDTVTVSISNADSLAKTHQIIPLEMSRDYIVPELSKYVSSIEQIPTEMIEAFANKYIFELDKENEEDSGWGFSYSPSEYHSAYLFTGKSNSWLTDVNRIVIVFSYVEHYSGGWMDNYDETEYVLMYFTDVTISTDGELLVDYDDCYTSYIGSDLAEELENYKEDYDVYEIIVD